LPNSPKGDFRNSITLAKAFEILFAFLACEVEAVGGEVAELGPVEGVEPKDEFADFIVGHGRKVTPTLLRARWTAWKGVTPAADSLEASLTRKITAW
jgi:hypothetical protein